MKQLQTNKVAIGDSTFYIRPFGAFTAANLSGDIVALVAPILSGLLALVPDDESKTLSDVSLDVAGPVLSSAFQKLSGEKVEEILRKLLLENKNITVSYKDEKGERVEEILSYDLANELFCLEVNNMYKLAWEVIKLNYGGFFGKVPALFGKATEVIRMTK